MPSKAVTELNVRLDERDWSLAIGVSERKIEVFEPKASRFRRESWQVYACDL